ncbi:MAG: hypothetical protein AB1465_00970 [Patescibacteria group bacterium]
MLFIFSKRNQNLFVFLAYIFIGLVLLLPAMFLISQNLAINLDLLPEFGKFFEKVKEFQGGEARNFGFYFSAIFSLYGIFYVFHLVFGEPMAFNLMLILLFFAGSCVGYCLFRQVIVFSHSERSPDLSGRVEGSQSPSMKTTGFFVPIAIGTQNDTTVILCAMFFGLLSLYFPITPFLGFFILFLLKFFESSHPMQLSSLCHPERPQGAKDPTRNVGGSFAPIVIGAQDDTREILKFGSLSLFFFIFLSNYSLFVGISTLLLVLIILAFWFFARLKISLKNLKIIKPFLIKMTVLFILFLLFFSWQYYFVLRKTEPLSLSDSQFLEHSLDPGRLLQPVLDFLQLEKSQIILGINFLVLLIIVLIGLALLIFAWCNRKKNQWISLLIFLSFLYFIFSLGPYLVFNEEFYQPKIALPYLFLYYYFPFFNQTADLSGFLMFGFVFLILAGSLGIYYLTQSVILRKREALTKDPPRIQGDPSLMLRMTVLLLSVSLFTIFAFWSFLKPGKEIPDFYKNLAQNKDNSKIVFLTPPSNLATTFLYENSIYGNSVIFKESLFFDNFNKKTKKNKSAVSSAIANYLPEGRQVNYANFINPDYKTTFSSYLEKENIKYIIFDSKFLDETRGVMVKVSENEWEEKKFQELLNLRKIVKFLKENTNGKWMIVGDKIVYELFSQKNDQILIYEGENWAKRDINPRIFQEEKKKELIRERWMLNDATLVVENYALQPKNLELFFKAGTGTDLRKLEVYFNDVKQTDFIVGPSAKSYLVNLDDIKPGKNTIAFKMFDYDGREHELTEERKTEGIKFFEVRYREIENSIPFDFYKGFNDGKILFLPAEIDYLKNNHKFIRYEDFVDKTSEKINSISLLDKLFFNNLDFKSTLDIINRDYYYQIGQETINRYNIRYIAIDKDWLLEQEFSDLAKFILYNFEIEAVPYNDDRFVVLRIKNLDLKRQIPINFEGNWGMNSWERRTGRFFNIAYDEARLTFVNPEEKNIDAKLKFKIENFQSEKRKIKVYLNEDWLDEKVLTEFDVLPMKLGEEEKVEVELSNLRPKDNEVMFKIFDENDKEVMINQDKGVRMSDFEIERSDAPIKKETASEVNYCNEAFKPIFEKYNFKKEFFDGFEDSGFTQENLEYDWRVRITQNEKYQGKQSLTTTNAGTDIKVIKNINGCFDKIDASIMVKANKWSYGADLYFDFIKENEDKKYIKEFPITQGIKSGFVLFPSEQGVYYNYLGNHKDFFYKFPIGKWINLKIVWQNNGQFELFKNQNQILKKQDFDKTMPTGVKIMVSGGNPAENIDIYFDDFKLNME